MFRLEPIAFLSNINKILERLMYKRLETYKKIFF